MDTEEILKRFQAHMGYTDEDMVLFKSDPNKVKMVTQTPEFVKCRVVAEVIESKGCHARHLVGDRFIITPGGQLITEQSPKRVCLSALSSVHGLIPAIYERLISKSDPDFKRSQVVQCGDIGLEKGGWGKILMKVFLEKIPD
jgi:uncharacterized repeat protein (TIGR04076 family)